MKKKILLLGGMAVLLLLSVCGNEASIEQNRAGYVEQNSADNVEQAEETDANATGSYSSMEITYSGKYTVEYNTMSSGHPGPDCDFETSFGWGNEDGEHGGCNIVYTVLDEYEGYDDLEEVMVADKTYKVVRDTDTVTLIYKVDDSFFIQVELLGVHQYDADGNSMDVTYTASDILDSGDLDEEIIINITPVD